LLPLRERAGDIIPLAMQFLFQQDKHSWRLHPQAQSMLLQYPWPGNVRELENVMRRAMVLCTDHHITPGHLMFDDWLTPSAVSASLEGMTAPLDTAPLQAELSSPPAPMLDIAENSMNGQAPMAPLATDLQSAVRMNEHQVILATLASTPSKIEAAKRLGISPRTLRYKMAQLREHGLSMAAAC
jgi:two-component system response regulator FlrC